MFKSLIHRLVLAGIALGAMASAAQASDCWDTTCQVWQAQCLEECEDDALNRYADCIASALDEEWDLDDPADAQTLQVWLNDCDRWFYDDLSYCQWDCAI